MNTGKGQFIRVAALVVLFGVVAFAVISLRDFFGGDGGRRPVALVNFNEISAADSHGLRYLVVDDRVHTVFDIGTGQFRCGYAHILDLGKGYFENPGRMLLVGLGGGSVARSYAAEGWTVDAVEPDNEITVLARSKFGLKEKDARVHATTARDFLAFHGEPYKLIIVDAFGSRIVPVPILTEEGLGVIARQLTDDGVVMINLGSVDWHHDIVRSVAATLETQFENILALPMAEPPNTLGYVVLFASNRSLELAEEPPTPYDRTTSAYDRFHAWENKFRPDTRDVRVLTNKWSPFGVWVAEMKAAGGMTLDESRDFPGVAP